MSCAFSGGEREIVPAILHEELLSQPRVAAAREHLKRADKNPGRIGSGRFISERGQFEIVADAKSGRRLMPISVAKPRALEAKALEAECYRDVRSETGAREMREAPRSKASVWSAERCVHLQAVFLEGELRSPSVLHFKGFSRDGYHRHRA